MAKEGVFKEAKVLLGALHGSPEVLGARSVNWSWVEIVPASHEHLLGK